MIEIKQYGLPRSGTNLSKVLLQENYNIKVHTNIGGWKHGEYHLKDSLGKELDCIVSIKNPYSWLNSYYKWIHKKKRHRRAVSFEKFLTNTHIAHEITNGKPYTYTSLNPVVHWNKMNNHWLNISLESHKLFIIKYESILNNPEESLSEIVNQLNLKRTTDKFFMPDGKLGAYREVYDLGLITKKFDKNYYLNKEYLHAYNKDLLNFVKSNLDQSLMDKLGYVNHE